MCNQDVYCGGINFIRTGGDLGDCQLINGKDTGSFTAAMGYLYYENTGYGGSLNRNENNKILKRF
jgi:hypothetical protein